MFTHAYCEYHYKSRPSAESHFTNKIPDVLWLIAALRLKTIFYEMMERRGIQSTQDSHEMEHLSSNGNYLK